MILCRALFVVMVSVFLRPVVGAPVFETTTGDELLKSDTNLQDEVNFLGGISIPGEPNESKTKEAAKEEDSGDTFANFNPNNTIAYSSSNILPNDIPYDMIFIPSSEVPSDIELDLSSDFSDKDDGFDQTIDGDMGADELGPVDQSSKSDYGGYYSYIGDWRDLSWLTEFSEGDSTDENFENTLLGADDTDNNRLPEPSYMDDLDSEWSNEESDNEITDDQTNEVGGYEEAIDGVKTRNKRSLEGDFEDSEEEEDENGGNESSLSSSYYDVSMSSESSDIFSSVSEEGSEIDEAFNEVDPKRADIEKALARYPRPGDANNWDNDRNDVPYYEGDTRRKRAIDLFKYYAMNFPTLEGMRKRGNADLVAPPFDFGNIANDLVPAESKSKRSLHTARRVDNDAWDTLEESFDTSSYELGPFDEEQSQDLNNDIYVPDEFGKSREFGHFLPQVVPVPPRFESRRGHRIDIPDYNEGKYFAYRSANLNPLSKSTPIVNSPDVPDPADLLKLYRIVKNLNPQDVIDARKPRMYLPGPHAGYQAYGNEVHRAMFGSKRSSSLEKALLNPLPIGLVYRPRQTNTRSNDAVLNTIDEYLGSDTSSVENEMDGGGVDVATTLDELMKEIDELTIIEKLLRLVEISNEEGEQIRR